MRIEYNLAGPAVDQDMLIMMGSSMMRDDFCPTVVSAEGLLVDAASDRDHVVVRATDPARRVYAEEIFSLGGNVRLIDGAIERPGL